MELRSKPEFFKLWKAGVLGNMPKVYESLDEAMFANASRYGIRELGKAGGGAHAIVHGRDTLWAIARNWETMGRKFQIDGAAPDEKAVLQGEVCRTYRGLEGFLGVKTGMAMRPAIAAGLLKPLRGAAVLHLLRLYMDATSWETFWELHERFPDAAIEFTVYSINVGTLPHRNTIFWEVRNY